MSFGKFYAPGNDILPPETIILCANRNVGNMLLVKVTQRGHSLYSSESDVCRRQIWRIKTILELN